MHGVMLCKLPFGNMHSAVPSVTHTGNYSALVAPHDAVHSV